MNPLGGARFRLLTGREDAGLAARLSRGRHALDVLDAHLGGTGFLVADAPSIADLALYPYISRAGDAGVDPAGWPAVAAWLERLRGLPGFVDDLVPYPPSARPGRSRSIYD